MKSDNYSQHADTKNLLESMVEVIVEIASPEKIILFGSQARGTAREDSDYDFLIIDAEPFDGGRSRWQSVSKLGRALAKFRVPKDILLYSAKEVEQRRHWQNNVMSYALEEGKVLYERA